MMKRAAGRMRWRQLLASWSQWASEVRCLREQGVALRVLDRAVHASCSGQLLRAFGALQRHVHTVASRALAIRERAQSAQQVFAVIGRVQQRAAGSAWRRWVWCVALWRQRRSAEAARAARMRAVTQRMCHGALSRALRKWRGALAARGSS